jgi:hypothetical protein
MRIGRVAASSVFAGLFPRRSRQHLTGRAADATGCPLHSLRSRVARFPAVHRRLLRPDRTGGRIEESPSNEKEKTMTTRNRNNNRKNRDTQPPALIAYHVAERGEKNFWTRIGAAWDHEDGKGLTLQLDLVPVNGGRIVLREAADEQAAEGKGA